MSKLLGHIKKVHYQDNTITIHVDDKKALSCLGTHLFGDKKVEISLS